MEKLAGSKPNGHVKPAADKSDDDSPAKVDLSQFRLTQDFNALVGAKEIVTAIEVRPPRKGEWMRMRTGPDLQWHVGLLESDGERYIVLPKLFGVLGEVITRRLLTLCITRSGVLFVWPLPMPSENGRTSSWADSAAAAAHRGSMTWVRTSADLSAGAYRLYEAPADGPLAAVDPQWPTLEPQEWIARAFGAERIIDTLDHPIVRRLQGKL